MFKKILLILGLAAAGFAALVMSRPSTFRISRSVVIRAAPEAVFPHVNELKKWEAWNPWGRIDPKARMTYEGPGAGVGASYAWDSASAEVGAGRNTIVESHPNESVRFRLEFFRPLSGVNDTRFAFQPESGGTKVTWSMTGQSGFIGRAIGLFVDCDRMVGDQFSKGLAEMKRVVEAGAGK